MNKPNIILITIDSFRPDYLSFNGYPKNTTPFIDSVAKRGVYFKNAFSTGPGSSVSFVGMFTSTYPLDYGGYSYIEKPRRLFSEVLKDAGYTTLGLHSSPYLSDYFGYNRGWDEFHYLNHFRKSKIPISPGFRRGTLKSKTLKRATTTHGWLKAHLPPLAVIFKIIEKTLLLFRKIIKDILAFKPAYFTGEEINREVEKILHHKTKTPLFLWIHYLDIHAPYGLFERSGHGLIKKMKYHLSDIVGFLFGEVNFINRFFMPLYRSLYNDSLKYLDRNLESLFSLLEKQGLLNEDTVVIMNGDHGEEFLEHGSFGHPQKLFNVNVKVPLIFYSTKGRFSQPSVISRPVSLIDLAPTILKLADLPLPANYRGIDIFSDKERAVIIQASESSGDLTNPDQTGVAVISGGHKLIHWKNQKLLFALSDDKEESNLYKTNGEIVKKLEVIKDQYLSNLYQAPA